MTSAIATDKVCYIIVKAREFDAKEGNADPDSGSNTTDDGMADVLEDKPDDPVYRELGAFIQNLNEDEQLRSGSALIRVPPPWSKPADCGRSFIGRECIGRGCYGGQRFDEASPLGSGKCLHERLFRAPGREPCTPQRLAPSLGNCHCIGTLIVLDPLTADKTAFEHAPHHFRERRAIDARGLHECSLADTFVFVLLQRKQNQILLFGQILRSVLARIQVAVKLMAAAHKVCRRLCEIDVSVRFALPSGYHATTPEF